MTNDRCTLDADTDLEARQALWEAACLAAEHLRGRCLIYISSRPESMSSLPLRGMIPDVPTWKLVEAVSFLTILMRADEIRTSDIYNLFGRTGPIRIVEDGQLRHLWAQPRLKGHDSDLGGIPDLLVTSETDTPSSANALRVVECKCRKQIGAEIIRAEFGKAHDLRVASYFIWSFTTPSPRIIAGARKLGIEVEALGFDQPARGDLISKPENLVYFISNALERSRRDQRFAKTLLASSQQANSKIMIR